MRLAKTLENIDDKIEKKNPEKPKKWSFIYNAI